MIESVQTRKEVGNSHGWELTNTGGARLGQVDRAGVRQDKWGMLRLRERLASMPGEKSRRSLSGNGNSFS